jgi:hypothetical protein
MGYQFLKPARGSGIILSNPPTGEAVRIMERPPRRFGEQDPAEKHVFERYYRYQSAPGDRWGAPVPIPEKPQ